MTKKDELEILIEGMQAHVNTALSELSAERWEDLTKSVEAVELLAHYIKKDIIPEAAMGHTLRMLD